MAPMVHSFAVGGSSAQRLLKCPANIQARLRLPPGAVTDSAISLEAANEGTELHDHMEQFFLTGELLPGLSNEQRALIDRAYDSAMAAIDEHMPDAEVYGVEVLVESILPGCFGTTDVVMLSPSWIAILDWKFGSYPVLATYDNEANPQGMFYLSGLRRTAPYLFAGRDKFLIVIAQPKCGDVAESVVVGVDELDAFDARLTEAFVTAINPRPPYKKGDWCTFCHAKPVCPMWTAPALNLAMFRPKPTVVKPSVFSTWLGEALNLIEGLKQWTNSVEPAALAWLESGEKIPGWELKPKRATRKWAKPEPDIQAALLKLGHPPAKIAPPSLLTPAQMEKAIGTLPAGLVVQESSGNNVAPSKDKPSAPREDQAMRFLAATDALEKGGNWNG